MTATTEIIEEWVRFSGSAGRLEGRLLYPMQIDPGWSAVIAGPHPLLGGDMNNNVVRVLSEGLAGAGGAVLSFNYGGVGRSEGGPTDWPAAMSAFWRDGRFDQERQWVDDAGWAIAALKRWCDRPLVLVGYSFGCWAISQHAGKPDQQALLLISPNPVRHQFDGLAGCATSVHMIYSDNDFSCTTAEVMTWFGRLREPKSCEFVPACEHFFRGHEHEVLQSVLAALARTLPEKVFAS